MAFSKDQQEPSVPVGSNNKRSSADFLPRYFRTGTNQKFLGATIDQLISEGEVDKVNAFIGRRNTRSRVSADRYLEDVSTEREAYQLSPSLVIKDNLENVTFFKDYNDYINQIKFFNNENPDHNHLNSQEMYSWNPHIDWDKFINFREYYWLPNGPYAISIAGQTDSIVSTYSVSLSDEIDNQALIFSPVLSKDGAIVINEGLIRNPSLKLYRGQTYKFEIQSPNQPITFKTLRDTSDTEVYRDGITKTTLDTLQPVTDDWIEEGVITFQVPLNAPNILYYISRNDINTSGIFKVYDITEASAIDVDAEIVGKKTYRTSSGVELSNGMKVQFLGRVTPEKYSNGFWYVEGVGKQIYLVAEKDLETPAIFTTNEDIEFDNEKFDSQGYDVNSNYPATKDYITVNRGSKDRNAWSRYNRWFHRTVIETSAKAVGQIADVDQSFRATRPIIEFAPGLQLVSHGKQAKANVDLVDDFTTDIFSTIEGSLGYNVDGVNLVEGMRVLFTADTDNLVNGRIFRVGKVTHLNVTRLTLVAVEDTEPTEGETVLVLSGDTNRGEMFYYKDGKWNIAQNKTAINQPPLFDVFDSNGYSYADNTVYTGTTFIGSKVFSYRNGSYADSELGFNIAYKNIGNIGDIVFDFNLHTDSFSYQDGLNVVTRTTDTSYLKINNGLLSTKTVNGWVTTTFESYQPVVRIYEVTDRLNFFEIDVYDKSGNLTDLTVDVFVNNKKQKETDFTIFRQDGIAYVQFYTNLSNGDILTIETTSSVKKNNNGFYKFPINLENNPENLSLTDFTLGEIVNHVQSIEINHPLFTGEALGANNLRDLGDVSGYGTKIVQHSSPLLPVVYHVTNKKFNVISALRYARDEYSKFKRNLIRTATDYGFDGNTDVHLDLILRKVTKEKIKESPYYLSDMVPFSGAYTFNQTVIDNAITDYPLTFDFDLTSPSEKAVMVYVNDEILVYGYDYEFVNTNFVRILRPIVSGDSLKIVQYSSTDGCCVPPTPSKLGLYPTFKPQIFIDTTYQTPTKVIQGHDGSITVAFNDYRDDLLLEFETRIFNNIKVQYDVSLFDLHDYISGFSRKTVVTRDELTSVLRQEFLKWANLISNDYTKHDFFDESRTNQFTFNYSDFSDPDNNPSLGYWRGIFKYFYDTDRPHTHPWEMLGITHKPSWWETVYGPAPYTRDNLVLWSDLAKGIVREPGKAIVYKSKYIRPMLLSSIPVDEVGNLVSPIQAGLVVDYVATSTKKEFTFGDQAPVETAWRRSSEYPFSIITALTLIRPAKVFATCFDRVRQFRDSTGQIVYQTTNGNSRFSCSTLITPNTVYDSSRVFTAGLANYLVDYAISSSTSAVSEYRADITSMQIKMACKLGGFTSKEKFKLILDSRTPLNQGNVFIPEENYNIVLNTSSPVLSINYSGVIIEKQPSGFIIKGYNKPVPEFKYLEPVITASDPVITIGGISESYVDWDSEKTYIKGAIVRFDQNFFRVTTAHTSSTVFETKYFAKLPALPVTGGREVILRRNFKSTVSRLHYGAELKSIQEVVDFLMGYGEYLKQAGFVFEFYNSVLKTVTDWQTAAREFVFWTTQNWAAGAVISLSPAAEELKFYKEYAVVDNIYDNFYEYTVLKEDGTNLDSNFISSVRLGNNFTLTPKGTADGVYHATLNLVQKEHVLILDDVTVFNDIIYDQVQGYHQERIKVLGYKTSNWNGDFSIPGFVYDRATITEWKSWHDYAMGETVKYKEFYYSAIGNTPGTETFEHSSWYKLDKKPESRLLPNWDYRANQFPDFYDLDSDSFDVDQQKFAQHLIGYQKRKYLENIINDDVAQYKFYQGMIREKGTQNSLSKLFDALNTADKDSLEFYEEWAIRLGQYGASAGFEEVEYLLDETKFLINPQPVELVNQIDPTLNDLVYRITPDQVYLAPEGYTHSPFPTSLVKDFITTSGYVNRDDVSYIVSNKSEFANYSISDVREGTYFWVVEDNKSWNVYRFSMFTDNIDEISDTGVNLTIVLNNNKDSDITVGDYIGIYNAHADIDGIHQVVDVSWNSISIVTPDGFDTTLLSSINNDKIVNLYKFTPQRISNIDNINSIYPLNKKQGELVWVDNTASNWRVWEFEKVFTYNKYESGVAGYGMDTAVNDTNDVLAVSMFDKVYYYNRPDASYQWVAVNQLSNNLPLYHYNLVSNYENFNIRQSQTISGVEFSENGSGTYVSSLPGVTTVGKTLKVNPYDSYFAGLVAGESKTINVRYVITNNLNETYQQNETVVVSGPASSPTVTTELERIKVVTSGSYGWNLTMSTDGDQLFVSAPLFSDLTYSANTGAVAYYVRNQYNEYNVANVYTPRLEVTETQFGFKTELYGNILVIASRGNLITPASLTMFNVTTGQELSRQELPVGSKVNDTSLSLDGVLTVATTDEKVYVYQVQADGTLVELTIITTSELDTRFATSVAITRDSKTIAIGAPQFEGKNPNQGKVKVYNLDTGSYTFAYDIFSPVEQESEEFGTGLRFNIVGDQLAVYSQGGSQVSETTFDERQTVFDLGTTTFQDVSEYVGLVRVYDKYNTKFVFADNLEVTVPNPLGSYFGSQLTFTDRIYVNDPTETNGAIYEFGSNRKSWIEYRTPTPPVDISKIKSIFMYDTEKNAIVSYLDFIDPIKGKILGIAEQEISFKTYYDPAVYSIGTDSTVVNPLSCWKDDNVGKLWWDLSTAKFVNPYQGSALYKANTWNELFESSSIDIYEWVETEYLPSEWDALADTEEGLTEGISGTSKYGDLAYVVRENYDSIGKTFKNVYYFWVKNKVTVPNVDFRKISASDVSVYISDPKSKGVKYVAILGSNQFSLVNCKELIADRKVAINFRYWVIENQDINIHAHYQLVAAGDMTKELNQYVEKKWFDSLIGYDSLGNEVPDFRLPAKLKYGILSKPRQSMFVNRTEALKQFIERVNTVLVNKLIVDDYDISSLSLVDEPPTVVSGNYDVSIDTYSEIRFVGLTGVTTASLTPIVDNGKITRVIINNPGKGYGRLTSFDNNGLWYGPKVEISGTGIDAQIVTVVDSKGSIVEVIVEKEGNNYTSDTTITIRPFTVLVLNDETINGKWALYTLNTSNKTWFRSRVQIFNTARYWDYIDWYAPGYNQFTKINYDVDFSYQIHATEAAIGETIRVKNSGKQGWILFEKINDQATTETTVNYKVVGREAGTIQFKSTLYRFINNNVGFDGPTFDNDLYDDQPKQELRIILECIKNNLFVDELAAEYNNLFFASIRYAFSEQPFIDWAFKTSFVKSVHNLGSLEQKSTFQNDTLTSYEDYISEVKPYRTKIREFVSNFDTTDNTRSVVTDFDLPVRYDSETKSFKPIKVTVSDYGIVYDSATILTNPYVNWYSNVGNSVQEIVLVNSGSGYKAPPTVTIEGYSTSQATATAYLSAGTISKIVLTNSGAGYLTTPRVVITGAIEDAGTPATAVAIMGNSLIRSIKVDLKFDRTTANYVVGNLDETQTFTNVVPRAKFVLTWPANLSYDSITVLVNNDEVLHADFTVYNQKSSSLGYTSFNGVVEFLTPATTIPVGATITISYKKDVAYMNAADRIQHYYTPSAGQIGKDFGQLMTGVDYGGVEITGVNFNVSAGWDALPWYTTGWDNYDSSYSDHVVVSDQFTRSFTLPYAPADGEVVTVYVNGKRIDDVYYDEDLPSGTALMSSFVGDGSTDVIVLPDTVTLLSTNTIIFRKITSDGSMIPLEGIFDVELSGGDLSYSTARGIRPSEIIVDGDGFITTMTSHAPEEVVPGHVVDTLNIGVYHKVADGTPVIVTRHYNVVGTNNIFEIGQQPSSDAAVLVKVNKRIVDNGIDYIINYSNKTVELLSLWPEGTDVVVTSLSNSGTSILDVNTFVGDSSTLEFVTSASWIEPHSVFVTVNGLVADVTTFKTDYSFQNVNNIGLLFNTPPADGSIISYIVVADETSAINLIQAQTIIHDGSTNVYPLTINVGADQPKEISSIVEVDGKVLHPSDFVYFVVAGTTRTYTVNPVDYAYNSINITDISVYKNGTKLTSISDYTWSSSTNELKIKRGVAVVGDNIILEIYKDSEYSIHTVNNTNELLLVNDYPAGTKITVTMFTNKESRNIERSTNFIKTASDLQNGTVDYYNFTQITSGRFTLRRPALAAQYVWISLNNELLTPNVDYILEESKLYIRLNPNFVLTETDQVDIIVFASNSVSREPFGYQIFKDMLNRVSYNRVDSSASTTLLQALNYYDESIVVTDASVLPVPSRGVPGVVMINAERIEYFQVSGNVLSQLRRGTYGTGVKSQYPVGTLVSDFSRSQLVPYSDNLQTVESIADGSSLVISLDFVPVVDSSTVELGNNWYRESIPENYGQSNDIEVFVAGRRLRKAPTAQWNVTLGPTSPLADETHEAEFSVDGISAAVRLTVVPPQGVQILVTRKTGRLWAPVGTSLADAETEIAQFIRAKTAYLPDTKYYSTEGAPSDNNIVTENNTIVQDESGNPLELE